jgi:hypothetical protein
LFVTALTPLPSFSSLPPAVAPTVRAAAPASVAPSATPMRDTNIGARVDSQVAGGALSADQGTSLKDFFGDSGEAGSTGSLIRRAGAQLDQFDRVLDKLRASLGGGATYGGQAPGSSGLVVDRLA